MTDRSHAPIEQRVLRRIEYDPNGGCWLWPGACLGSGYGVVKVGVGQNDLTHRVMFRHFKGQIPDGLEIDHRCRVKTCCNPVHLEAVTGLVNTGRWAAEKTHCANGHEFDEQNTHRYGPGLRYRACRACGRARRQKRLARPEVREQFNRQRRKGK